MPYFFLYPKYKIHKFIFFNQVFLTNKNVNDYLKSQWIAKEELSVIISMYNFPLHKEGFTLNDNLLFLLKTLNKNDFS